MNRFHLELLDKNRENIKNQRVHPLLRGTVKDIGEQKGGGVPEKKKKTLEKKRRRNKGDGGGEKENK